MQVMPRQLVCLAALLAHISAALPGSTSSGQAKRFVSAAQHFWVSFPGTWYEYSDTDPTAGVLYIVSFSPERRVQGVFIPRGGAEIVVRPADCGGARYQEWVDSVARDAAVISRSAVVLVERAGRAVVRGKRIVLRVQLGPKAFLRETYLCVSTDHRDFQARLAFWEEDPAATNHEKVLESVLKSIRLTR